MPRARQKLAKSSLRIRHEPATTQRGNCQEQVRSRRGCQMPPGVRWRLARRSSRKTRHAPQGRQEPAQNSPGTRQEAAMNSLESGRSDRGGTKSLGARQEFIRNVPGVRQELVKNSIEMCNVPEARKQTARNAPRARHKLARSPLTFCQEEACQKLPRSMPGACHEFVRST